MMGYVVVHAGHDPRENLSVEEYLFDYVSRNNCFILYLWQNDPAVIIGRHQNAYTECNLSYAKANGISVVRRKSGGGTVYHDLGNLTYTIITPREFYEIKRSTKLIVTAMQKLGIAAMVDGRNDICLKPNGEKISGNAYRSSSNAGMHHGTILFNADFDAMEKLLSVSSAKLSKHGVRSTRSRVTNIFNHYPTLTISMIREQIINEFETEYHLPNLSPLYDVTSADISPYIEKYCQDEWNIGLFSDYDIRLSKQFPWGNVVIGLTMKYEFPHNISIETDALEIDGLEIAQIKTNEELAKKTTDLAEIFSRNVFRYIESRVIANDLVALFDKKLINGMI